MTIASEISRLQTDKECIRQAIIGKGVSVAASVSLDNYASCINAIQSGKCLVSVLVVGGGGAGACGDGNNRGLGGGGGGGIVDGYLEVTGGSITVTVGAGGSTKSANGTASCAVSGTKSLVGSGGYGGCTGNTNGGRGGYACRNGTIVGGGYNGGNGYCTSSCYPAYAGGGGGGATSIGCAASCGCGADGGKGLLGYGGGGGGGSDCVMPRCRGCGYDGGGCGGNRCMYSCPTDATNYGGGGGGSSYGFGKGCQGIVKICYPSDGSFGFSNASGGTKSICCGVCVHTFTSNGTFTIVS